MQSFCHKGSAFVLYLCNAQNTEALDSKPDINKHVRKWKNNMREIK